jgi:hypothetical protein
MAFWSSVLLPTNNSRDSNRTKKTPLLPAAFFCDSAGCSPPRIRASDYRIAFLLPKTGGTSTKKTTAPNNPPPHIGMAKARAASVFRFF